MDRVTYRRIVSRVALTACLLLSAVAVFPLLSVLWEVTSRGWPAVSWQFLTGIPQGPLSPGGGIRHAIIGTGLVVGIGTAIGAPVGLIAGTYLSEYRHHRWAPLIRTTADVMSGIPSIVVGLFAYTMITLKEGHSAYGGGIALSIIMIPILTRTTEEALRTVPSAYREAGLALGAPRWYTTLFVVIPSAKASVLTGLLLSVARIAGETAPLLLTVLDNPFVSTDPKSPVATLPTLIYYYAKSAQDSRIAQSWGAALVLITMVMVVNITVRLLTRRRKSAST